MGLRARGFTEVAEFTEYQAIQALFMKSLDIKVYKFLGDYALEIYTFAGDLLAGLTVPLLPTKEEVRFIIDTITELRDRETINISGVDFEPDELCQSE